MNNGIALIAGDSRQVLREHAADSFDSCVTDPPYALVSITKRFGATAVGDDTQTSDRSRRGADGYARLARGFMGQEWDNGSTAFDPDFWREVFRVLKPGAHVVAFGGTRTYHRLACAIEDGGFEIRDMVSWIFGSGFPKSHNAGDGWGTALKPALEPIVLARKPLIGTVAANVLQHGTGAINVDGCRVPTSVYSGRQNPGTGFDGGSKAAGTTDLGRWPANVVHDGSEEVIAAFPSEAGAFAPVRGTEPSNVHHGDSGSAARFFYSAKADSDDRLGSKHPTVKPVDLMQWLVRLVTPKGGLVLDPFAGTGTTGEAAWREGARALLIEREPAYCKDIERRIALLLAGPDERARESIKASGKMAAAGPLFE